MGLGLTSPVNGARKSIYGGHFRLGVGEWLYTKRYLYVHLFIIHSFCLAGVGSFQGRWPYNDMSPIHSFLSDLLVYTVMNTQFRFTSINLKRSIPMIGLLPDRQHLDRPG